MICFKVSVPHCREADTLPSKLKHALLLTLTLSSDGTLPMTVDWLQKFCEKRDNQSDDLTEFVIPSLQEVRDLVQADVNEEWNVLDSSKYMIGALKP